MISPLEIWASYHGNSHLVKDCLINIGAAIEVSKPIRLRTATNASSKVLQRIVEFLSRML
jgi:hypothetical protein